MKPGDVRQIERICLKKSMVEMALSILNEADTMFCGENVKEARRLLEEEAQLLDYELQNWMD